MPKITQTNIDTMLPQIYSFLDELRISGFNIGIDTYHEVTKALFIYAESQSINHRNIYIILKGLCCKSLDNLDDFNARFESWQTNFPRLSKHKPVNEDIQSTAKLSEQEKKDQIKNITRIIKFTKNWAFALIAVAMFSFLIQYISRTGNNTPVDDITITTSDPNRTNSNSLILLYLSLSAGILSLYFALVILRSKKVKSFLLPPKNISAQYFSIPQLFSNTINSRLWDSPLIERTLFRFSQHLKRDSNKIDIVKTISATIYRGGFYSPQLATQYYTPEYLVLLNTLSINDNQAAYMQSLINKLIKYNVQITLYYYNLSPLVCHSAKYPTKVVNLKQLRSSHPQCKLIFFSDGKEFVDPITGEGVHWLTEISTWHDRTLFTIKQPDNWGYLENLLTNDHRFKIYPISQFGLTNFVHNISFRDSTNNNSFDFSPEPRTLSSYPAWVDLDDDLISISDYSKFLHQLREYLGEECFLWLCACAVYPELNWHLTLLIGYNLLDITDIIDDEGLLRMIQLPWFKQGRLPNWLRNLLIQSIPPQKKVLVQQIIHNLFQQGIHRPLESYKLNPTENPDKISTQTNNYFLKELFKTRLNVKLELDSIFQNFMISVHSFVNHASNLKYLFGVVFIVMLLSYTLPSGEFQREIKTIEGTERTVILPGTYEKHPKHLTVKGFFIPDPEEGKASPVSLEQFLSAIPRGMDNSADIIFFIFIIGGVLGILQRTGMVFAVIQKMLEVFGDHTTILTVTLMMIIAIGSSTLGMGEEFIPLVPLFLIISKEMGYDRIFGLAIVMVAADVGFAAATTNPFTVNVAQGIAELPINGTVPFRVLFFAAILLVTIYYILRYGAKVKKNPAASLMKNDDFKIYHIDSEKIKLTRTHIFTLVCCIVIYVGILWSVISLGWWMAEMSGGFLLMGFIAVVVSKLSVDEATKAFIKGMKEVAIAAIIVGFARGIQVVLDDSQILDTLIFSTTIILKNLPNYIAAEGMLLFHTILNFLIPSGSGQAAVTMPLMAPLSDVLGISRQTAVFAFTCGDGFSNTIIPTSGVLMAMLSLAGIPYTTWLRFIIPLFLRLLLLSAIFLEITVYFPAVWFW